MQQFFFQVFAVALNIITVVTVKYVMVNININNKKKHFHKSWDTF